MAAPEHHGTPAPLDPHPPVSASAARASTATRGRRRSIARGLLTGGVLLVVAAGAFIAGGGLSSRDSAITAAEVRQAVADALASQAPDPAWSVPVYAVALPSLVTVLARTQEGVGDEGVGLGSGVLVDAAGTVLTAYHVVADAMSLELRFPDGSSALATVVATQPEKDIAVLAADRLWERALPATLGNPNALPVGSEAYVIGSPSGLVGSMSAGIISGLGRSFTLPETNQRLTGLIQVDTAVNPGNSGGPLLNRAGHVVGIVTALLNPSGADAFSGIGFAVPIDVAGGAAGLPPY